MDGKRLSQPHSPLQIIQTIAVVVMALGFLFTLFSLQQYEPGERVQVLAEATQQAVSTIISTDPIHIEDGEVLTKDTQCLWVNVEVQGRYYQEYQVGYLREGEVIKRTGKTHLLYSEVLVDASSRLSRYTNVCWIKE